MLVEMEFPPTYDVQVLEEMPARRGVEHQFARDGRIVDGGVLIEVVSESGRWDGLVANAPDSLPSAVSGIYSTPSSHVVAVIAKGDAYFIDVEDPEGWWALEDAPIVAVRSAVGDGLLVLATSRRVVGVGADGVVWRTPRLAVDGISVGQPAGSELSGVADPRDEHQEFVIDLRSGKHRGGLPFPD